MMKVSIGMKIQSGPWGGGNQFGRSLSVFLQQKGVQVSYNLTDTNLDIILLTTPRAQNRSSAFTDRDVLTYQLLRNPNAIVIHRINECDERKGTSYVNDMLMTANQCADFTVFISEWLRDLFLKHGIRSYQYKVIRNGADENVFNSSGYEYWQRISPLKLVTHHWGGNYMKGFDIYEHVDELLSKKNSIPDLQFTYIGNLPDRFKFRHADYIPPKSGKQLASLIKQHHVYLTGSQNEPAGMHHIEGAMCGLPLLYRRSGALPEYCKGFGVEFTERTLESAINQMINEYEIWADRMVLYPYSSERMTRQYFDLFVELLDRRDTLLEKRKRSRWMKWLGLSLTNTRLARRLIS